MEEENKEKEEHKQANTSSGGIKKEFCGANMDHVTFNCPVVLNNEMNV